MEPTFTTRIETMSRAEFCIAVGCAKPVPRLIVCVVTVAEGA